MDFTVGGGQLAHLTKLRCFIRKQTKNGKQTKLQFELCSHSRAYFLLFTRPMMTQMNRKEANTSPMKACHTTQKPLRYAC